MHKYKISPTEALVRIKQSRPRANPNYGFVAQLELYYKMGLPTNVAESPMYQQWLGQMINEDTFEEDAESVKQDAASKASWVELRCKNCRYVILLSSNFLNLVTIISLCPLCTEDCTHKLPRRSILAISTKGTTWNRQVRVCLDPLSWPSRIGDRLECPKCKAYVGEGGVGERNLKAGLAKGKVDEVRGEIMLEPCRGWLEISRRLRTKENSGNAMISHT